jgi:hypothetical protein
MAPFTRDPAASPSTDPRFDARRALRLARAQTFEIEAQALLALAARQGAASARGAKRCWPAAAAWW